MKTWAISVWECMWVVLIFGGHPKWNLFFRLAKSARLVVLGLLHEETPNFHVFFLNAGWAGRTGPDKYIVFIWWFQGSDSAGNPYIYMVWISSCHVIHAQSYMWMCVVSLNYSHMPVVRCSCSYILPCTYMYVCRDENLVNEMKPWHSTIWGVNIISQLSQWAVWLPF